MSFSFPYLCIMLFVFLPLHFISQVATIFSYKLEECLNVDNVQLHSLVNTTCYVWWLVLIAEGSLLKLFTKHWPNQLQFQWVLCSQYMQSHKRPQRLRLLRLNFTRFALTHQFNLLLMLTDHGNDTLCAYLLLPLLQSLSHILYQTQNVLALMTHHLLLKLMMT